jgi:hypothetical protein
MILGRLHHQSGIALGPILFIIAILAVIAAAIAAGSGGFNASTSADGNKAKASAMIQIGDNLKTAMDRLTIENGVAYNAWTTSPNNTSNQNDLFSPTGGGIAPPSIALAANPASDVWYYPQGGIPGIGTTLSNLANTIQLAVLNVPKGVCAEINNQAIGQPFNGYGGLIGDFTKPPSSGNIAVQMLGGGWPTALYGRPVGCIYTNVAPTPPGFYFYQVLYIQ